MSDAPTWLWVLLSALLATSGAASASEAALFSLTQQERARAGRGVQRLLARPADLLVTVLLVNLVVNILFFAFADRLWISGGTGRPDGLLASLLALFGALFAVLIFGEILPKTLGLRMRVALARLSAPGWRVLMELMRPLRRILVGFLEALGRAGDRGGDERQLTAEELASALDGAAEEGSLLESEADLLGEIVELESVRVRELMTPRVDVPFLELDGANRAECVAEALGDSTPWRSTWLPVIDGSSDNVAGQVRLRDLLLDPERPLASFVMPVLFVPEVASALDLLRVLRDERATEAVCVDEWGGTAGVVTIEDVFEELLGDMRVEGEARQIDVVPVGEGVHRVPGGWAVRDWNERFGRRVVPNEFETVGGLVTALLGRIPQHGDVVRYENLVLEVVEVRGRRVLAVDVHVVDGDDAEDSE